MQRDLSAMKSEQHISIYILLLRVKAALLLLCGPTQNVRVQMKATKMLNIKHPWRVKLKLIRTNLPHRFIFDLFRLKVCLVHIIENIIMNGFDLQTNVRKI